jgi:hypothetical protein
MSSDEVVSSFVRPCCRLTNGTRITWKLIDCVVGNVLMYQVSYIGKEYDNVNVLSTVYIDTAWS